jgi:hypothetical protein
MNTKELEKWVIEVDKKLDNHLVHVSADISQIKNDIDWIKRFFWLVAGISVTSIMGALFSLIFK